MHWHGSPFWTIKHCSIPPACRKPESTWPSSRCCRGLPVSKARPKVEELLKERGLLTKVDDHKMAVGKCYRCKTVVEPYLSPQWFVDIKPLAEPAIKAVEDGRIRIIPEGWTNNYLGWMRDIKDWCISRQIWWGHQIPAWYCLACNTKQIVTTTHTSPSGTSVTRTTILQGATTDRREICSDHLPHMQGTGVSPRPRCPRYLVFLRTLALLHARLARADPGSQSLLSDMPPSSPAWTFCSSGSRA